MNARISLGREAAHSLRRLRSASKTPGSHRRCSDPRRQSGPGFLRRPNRQPQRSSLSQSEQDHLLRQRSLAEARQGNFDQAIAGLTLLLERNSRSAVDYNNRGLVYFQNGQLAEAMADYNQALKINPRLASVYNNRANYYAAQGDLVEAITDYEAALGLDPTNIRAWINQAITFRDLEMYGHAIDNLDNALVIQQKLGGNPGERALLEGHIYGERGRTHHLAGDWNYAIADYQRAFDRLLHPDTPQSAPSERLQIQIELWLDELLAPTIEDWMWDEDFEP